MGATRTPLGRADAVIESKTLFAAVHEFRKWGQSGH
jgi:hypothetical protein